MSSHLLVSNSPADFDIPMIHAYLSESYWARGIPLTLVERSIENSLCFGGFVGGQQVAFARVISDYATFANLVDLFVLPASRGNGYSKQLMQAIVDHPQLQGLRRFMLATRDAHRLYEGFGFRAPAYPESLMERYFPGIYQA